jgi:hypothetical protein
MLKYVVAVVSDSDLRVCQVTLCASERAVSGYQYLTGSDSGRWKYQHLSYVIKMPVPVRDWFSRHALSMATCTCHPYNASGIATVSEPKPQRS